MIKSLIRRSTVLGMVGATIVSTCLVSLKALALPQEQVVEKLNPIPVFTIADEQGAPLVATGEGNAKVTGVFISQQDALKFIERLKTENPDLATKVKVVPVPLGEVFKLTQEDSDTSDLNFAYVPNEAAVSDAKTVSGGTYENGVPLFVARGADDNGYLTIERNSQQVIPFFFDKAQIDSVVEQFKTQKPELAENISIEVIPLESVIQTLQTNDDPMLSKITIYPSTESLRFIQEGAAAQREQTQP